MVYAGQSNVSQAARLLADPPGFAVGWQEVIYLPPPAAGAMWLYTVPGGFWARLVAVRQVFTTSAVVASRNPRIQFQDANNVPVTAVKSGVAVAASSTITTSHVIGSADVGSGATGNVFGYLPNMLLPPGWDVTSVVTGLDPGDAFTTVTLVVQRFPEDAATIIAGE